MVAESDLAEVRSWVALRRLQHRYADVVTRRAWSELGEVLAPECVLVLDLADRQLEFTGPAEIADFIAAQLEQFSFFEFVIGNTVMEIDAQDGRARARMWMKEVRQAVADGRASSIHGLYHDDFERDPDGRWWFVHRRYRSRARPADGTTGADLDVFPLVTEPLDLS